MSSSGGRHQRLPQNDPDAPRQSRFHTIHDTPSTSNSSSSGSASGAGGYYQGGASGGVEGGNPCVNCCTNCCNFLPLFCRILIIVLLGGFIAAFFDNVYSNVILYAQIVANNPLNVYRVLVCTYFGGVVGALFGILHLFQDTAMMEHRKGTIYMMHLWFCVSLAVNTVFLLVMLIFSTFIDHYIYSFGPWPTLLALLPLEAKINGREEYNFCFCNIPAKYYPWLVLVLLSVLSFNVYSVPALLLGLLLGYAVVHFEDRLTLSMTTLRRWESGSLSWLAQQSAFVSTDAGASGNVPEPFSLQRMMTGGMAMPPPQAQSGGQSSGGRIYGSGTAGGGSSSSGAGSASGGSEYYYGMPPDEIEPDMMMEEKENAAQLSVFSSGAGHRLGGDGAGTSSSSSASRFTSLFSRSPAPAAAAPTSAAADSAATRPARIPTKGLNRLVENAYKQKGAAGNGDTQDVELSQASSSSSSSSAAVSVAASRVPAVDSSPLLAGLPSDSDAVAIAVSNGGSGSDQRERNIGRLVALGYTRDDARNALILADDDFEAARQFLSTPLTSSI